MSEELYELPEGWEWTKFKDVCKGVTPKYGWTTSAAKSGNIHLLRTSDITSGKIDWETVPYCEENPEDIKKYKLEKEDIVISRAGSIGYSHLIENPRDNAVFASYLIRFKPKKKYNPKYISYFLKSPQYWMAVSEKSLGMTISNINATKIKNIDFPLAPLEEQNQIVKKIEELITKLNVGEKELRKSKSQLETYQKLLLKFSIEGKLTNEWREDHELKPSSTLLKEIKNSEELVNKRWRNKLENIDESNLMDLPEIWEWTRIGKISNNIHYGYTESACDEKVGPKFLRITDIQDNKVDWKNVPFCEIEESKKSKYLLNKGDIVFARTGGTVGKNYLIKGDIPEAVFASYLIRIKLNKRAHPKYISYFFRTQRYWKQIYEGKIGIGQPNVNATKLSKIKVPLPPLEEQIKIAQILEGKTSIIDNLFNYIERNMKKTNILRQSFLKEAFRGNIISRNKINNLREKPLDRTNEEQKQERLDNYAE